MTIDQVEARVAASLHASDDLPVDRAAGWAGLQERMETAPRRRGRVLAIAAAAAVLIAGAVPLLLDRDASRTAPPVRPAPAPVTISPSGLPVGLLEGRVARTGGGDRAVSTFRLRVRPDGTGSFTSPSGEAVEGGGSYTVEWVRIGPGRVAMAYGGPVCSDPRALTLSFTVRGRTVVILGATSSGCLASDGLADDLVGTTLRIRPLPQELSPSGLPVGLLKAPMDLRVGQVQAEFWLVVRPDGTGSFRLWDVENDDQTNEVRLVARGPGTVRILSDSVACRGPEVLTLGYERTNSRVTLVSAHAPGSCLVSTSDVAALTGLTMPVRPLPAPADQ